MGLSLSLSHTQIGTTIILFPLSLSLSLSLSLISTQTGITFVLALRWSEFDRFYQTKLSVGSPLSLSPDPTVSAHEWQSIQSYDLHLRLLFLRSRPNLDKLFIAHISPKLSS